MLLLEVWIVTFGESLVEHSHFGSLADHTFGESLVENARFGILDGQFLMKVSWKILFFKAWILTFGAMFALEASILKSRGKCSFWKLGFSCGAGR